MSDLGERMKRYEKAARTTLPENLPIIIRLDGNNFSKLTKNFQKPFSSVFEESMDRGAKEVVKYCSGVEFGYVQSDEISILLRNDKNQADAFLGNRIQKLVSLTASRASVHFSKVLDKNAYFDSRVFVLPFEEVVSYFIWRQEDAFRNCVSSVAYYGLVDKYNEEKAQNILYGVSTNERQDIIFKELGKNINDIHPYRKRGRTIVKKTEDILIEDLLSEEKFNDLLEKNYIEKGQKTERSEWVVDENIPMFTKDRKYISKFLK